MKFNIKSIGKISANKSINKKVEQTDFAINFLKLENNKQNMIYSPLSIKYALKMLNEGASGNTMSQIEKVIGNQDVVRYENIGSVLSLANAVYIKKTYFRRVKKDYKKILADKYNTEVNCDSFNNAKNINKWICNKTLGIIRNMVRDDMVKNPLSKMILINALAIDMEWETQLSEKSTGPFRFFLEDGSIMEATTMKLETYSKSISYYKGEDITVLAMDLKEYNKTQLEFIAIMPENNLSNYIKTFTIDKFNNILNNLSSASQAKDGINIIIPRFSFGYDLNLKNDLMKLGINDAFDMNLADFSKISDERLWVWNALHKANIDFTEKGIKAVGATVIVAVAYDMACYKETQPVQIIIDKPFLYAIRDKKTNEIWFMGTVYKPNAWEDDNGNYKRVYRRSPFGY